MSAPERLWERAGIIHEEEGYGVVKFWTRDEVTAYFYAACEHKTVPLSSVQLAESKSPFTWSAR